MVEAICIDSGMESSMAAMPAERVAQARRLALSAFGGVEVVSWAARGRTAS